MTLVFTRLIAWPVGNTQQLGGNLYTNEEVSINLPTGWKRYENERLTSKQGSSFTTSIFGLLIGIAVDPSKTAPRNQLLIFWDGSSGKTTPTDDDMVIGIGIRDLEAMEAGTSLEQVVNNMIKTVQGLAGDVITVDPKQARNTQDGTPAYFVKYTVTENGKKTYGQSLFAIKNGNLYEVSWFNKNFFDSQLSKNFFDSFSLK